MAMQGTDTHSLVALWHSRVPIILTGLIPSYLWVPQEFRAGDRPSYELRGSLRF